jgi:hypothetical protein
MRSIDRIEIGGRMVWRVCDGDQCREHEQEWQARVWHHSLIEQAPKANPQQEGKTPAGD